MNNVYKMRSEDRQYREVSEWVSRLDRGLSDAEKNELRIWIKSKPGNKALLLEVVQLWDKMDSLSWLTDLFDDHVVAATKPDKPDKSVRWQAIAASLLVVIFSGVGIYQYISNVNEQNAIELAQAKAEFEKTVVMYETAIGEQSTITLSDGSVVVLNTNSQLRVRYTKHQRVLHLRRGEVHVDVAKDNNRPLSVIAGDKIVQAVGTAFAVEINTNKQVELVVTEGQVLVGSKPVEGSGFSAFSAPVLPDSSIKVQEGQKLHITDPMAQVEIVTPEEIEVQLSWRKGSLVFRGENLEDVLKEVSKYTTVEFVFLKESLRYEAIAGRYKAGDVEGLLAALRENVGITYERTDDERILIGGL